MVQFLPYKLQKFVYDFRKKKTFFPRNKSIVSFTFDDVPSSAIVFGGQLLTEYKYKGTFYVSGGLCGQDSNCGQIAIKEQIESLWEKGHEIGNHTYNHIDCLKNPLVKVSDDLNENINMFSNIMSGNLSFPFGSSDFRLRLFLRSRFTSCRGINPGINRNLIDLLNIKAVPVYSSRGLENCFNYLSELVEKGGWLVFYTHDICNAPSPFGCKNEDFQKLLEKVESLKVPVATVKEVLEIL
jgi:peptidoglycan/xylan/chitin deacetylase (PgdA/CDA1 family)